MKLGNKSHQNKMLRILYGSDFHGSDVVYRKFISAAFQYQADVLIVVVETIEIGELLARHVVVLDASEARIADDGRVEQLANRRTAQVGCERKVEIA